MKLFRRIADSPAILVAASAVFLGALFSALFPVSNYLQNASTSVVENFYLMGLLMLTVCLSAAAFGLLLIRLIWGPAPEEPERRVQFADAAEAAAADAAAEMRGLRVTGTKRVVVLLTVLAGISILADQLGGGVLLTDTRAVRVLTLLRSTAGQDRADAVNDAVLLVGDVRVQDALKRILTQPGEAREWAAYAAGVRKDEALEDDLLGLLRSGNDRERAAAAVALARMGDERLIVPAAQAYTEMKTLRGDILKAFGMLGRRVTMEKRNIEAAGNFLAGILSNPAETVKIKQSAVWAAGNFNAPEALLPIESMLHGGADTATMCIGLEALGKIGSASSSPKLVAALHKFNKSSECPEVVYKDFSGHEVLICSRINIIERLLHEIAHIGDRSARPEILKLSNDNSFSPSVRRLAAEIAFQMKYKPVAPISKQ